MKQSLTVVQKSLVAGGYELLHSGLFTRQWSLWARPNTKDICRVTSIGYVATSVDYFHDGKDTNIRIFEQVLFTASTPVEARGALLRQSFYTFPVELQKLCYEMYPDLAAYRRIPLDIGTVVAVAPMREEGVVYGLSRTHVLVRMHGRDMTYPLSAIEPVPEADTLYIEQGMAIANLLNFEGVVMNGTWYLSPQSTSRLVYAVINDEVVQVPPPYNIHSQSYTTVKPGNVKAIMLSALEMFAVHLSVNDEYRRAIEDYLK